jgi:hypothetical protein
MTPSNDPRPGQKWRGRNGSTRRVIGVEDSHDAGDGWWVTYHNGRQSRRIGRPAWARWAADAELLETP